jgi:Tryptophan-rich sensory protein (mitochondrial benzodiazepine receptor homolog)
MLWLFVVYRHCPLAGAFSSSISGYSQQERNNNVNSSSSSQSCHPPVTSFSREKDRWRLPKPQTRVMKCNSRGGHGTRWPSSSSSSSLNASLPSIAWVATSAIGGMTGAPFVIQSTKTWYNNIPLPSFTPPNSVFAPVWTALYTLMGIASWRIQSILQKPSLQQPNFVLVGNSPFISLVQNNIILFSLIHYAMNISWAPIFFGLKRLRAGHILNVLLIMTLLPIVAVYFSIDLVSGVMLLPYLAWLILATKLSSGVCRLNPTEVKYGCWYNNAKLQDEIWKLRKQAAKTVGL